MLTPEGPSLGPFTPSVNVDASINAFGSVQERIEFLMLVLMTMLMLSVNGLIETYVFFFKLQH